MMIRGVTIIIRLSASRPMPVLRNSRLMYGSWFKMGTPASLRPSRKVLMPPKRTVPPSGTLTVVMTVTVWTTGCWTVMLPTDNELEVDVLLVLLVLVVDVVVLPPIPPKPDEPEVPPPKPVEPADPDEPLAPGPAPVEPLWPGAETKVKVNTSEMTLNCGKTESRTKRRSAETTAATRIWTPDGICSMTGWNPTANTPTVGVTLTTNGRSVTLATVAA
jgi:hypothetical protein